LTKKEKNELSTRQKKAIPVILSCNTLTEGIKRAGISKTIFYEWLKIDAFVKEYEKQKGALIDHIKDELRVSAGKAVKVLDELLQAEHEGVRYRVASYIVDKVTGDDRGMSPGGFTFIITQNIVAPTKDIELPIIEIKKGGK